jgi:nucleoid-associated protein YgaU
VGKNDTLTGIAARHLGRSSRWVQVLGMNRDQLKDGNSLKIGMVLKLPQDASQVSVVAETAIAR